MSKFIIQFLFLFIILWNNKKAKGKWFSSSGFLIGIYTICSFCGIFALRIDGYVAPYNNYYWLPMIQFDLFILLFLLPFRLFNESRIKEIVLPSRHFLDIFSAFIIIISFFSIVYYIGSVRLIFAGNDLSAMRNAMVAGEGNYFEVGILSTMGSVAAANYVFAIVLYFIYSIIGNSSKRCFLLLVSSFSEVIHVLAYVGRDGIVFWFFTFLFCYLFFYDFLPQSSKRHVKKLLIGSIAGLSIPFLLITFSRFGDSNIGSSGSVISYLGHAFIQGPLFFGLDSKPMSHGSGFPLFYEITGRSIPMYQGAANVGEWLSYKFSTFIVNLYINLGMGGLIAVCIGMLLFFRITVGHCKHRWNFGHFSIYLLYFQLIGEGVFYFKHYTRGGNLFIISTLVLSVLFSYSSHFNGAIVLKRQTHDLNIG